MEGDDPLFLMIPDNANYQPTANRGCYNLLSCALRSFYGALLQSAVHLHSRDHSRSEKEQGQGQEQRQKQQLEEGLEGEQQEVSAIRALVGGLLWSQGCNDSINVPSSLQGVLRHLGQTAADTYEDRQETFMREIRWCLEGVILLVHRHVYGTRKREPTATVPACTSDASSSSSSRNSSSSTRLPIPIVMVAVTATRPWMVHLRAIQHQQLNAPSRIPRLLTVDSLGSFLKTDCVHLTTAAALSLGHLLATAMRRLLLHPHSAAATHDELDKQLSIADMAPPHDLTLYAAFCDARCRCEEVLNDYYNNMTREDRLLNKKKYPIFGTDLKPVNFVSMLSSVLSKANSFPSFRSCLLCR